MAKYSNLGHNCSRTIESHATGYCWKQRTGAWACTLNDVASIGTATTHDLPPPKV